MRYEGTADFLQNRMGKLTASRMREAMSFKKDGKESAERTKLRMELVAERLSGECVSHFVNDAMKHGIDTEPMAKTAYEAETGRILMPCMTIDHPEIAMLAATPDALIRPDGLAEFKCPTTTTHIAWVMAGIVPEEHKPQMIAQMLCTGRKWCDFVSFDPRIAGQKRLFIRRFEPTQEELDTVEKAAVEFLDSVEAMFQFMAASEPA